MSVKNQRDHARDAAIARCDLNTLYGVIALLEGGTISSDCERAVQRIIRTCKTESARCLTRYDRALDRIAGTPQ